MKAIEETKRWVEDFVVFHNLCPFAAPFLEADALHYRVSQVQTLDARVMEIYDELEYLDSVSHHRTSLIVYDDRTLDFEAYLDMIAIAEDMIALQEKEYQIASFHPEYCFTDTDPEDPANRTNRSPFPMVHILRLDDVARAVAQHPDTHTIPQRNISYLRDLFSS